MLLYVWLGIFVLGLILYFMPVFVLDRRYEGFEDTTQVTDDPTAYLKQLKTMFQPSTIGTPDFQFSVTSPTPSIVPDVQRQGTTPVPDGTPTTSSTPSVPNPPSQVSTDSTNQGAAFQQTLPLPPAVSLSSIPATTDIVPLDNNNVPPNPPLEPQVITKYVEVPRKCPPPPRCPPPPQCPDMRDYIRKDSIPCWACKLK